jgi:hypothetical protein
MKIRYSTKEESNKVQRDDFLKLTPVQRFYSFLDLMNNLRKYPVNSKIVQKRNFLIEIKDD